MLRCSFGLPALLLLLAADAAAAPCTTLSPIALTAQPAGEAVTLEWTVEEGISTYEIFGTGQSPPPVVSGDTGSYIHYPAPVGVARTYTVQGVADESCAVAVSNEASATPLPARALSSTGDFDGDGKTDLAIFRPSEALWKWHSSQSDTPHEEWWGESGDLPAPGDYDGDGKTEIAVFRPSTGEWFIFPNAQPVAVWGEVGDLPVPADYDKNGRADFAVFRPSNGFWGIHFNDPPPGAPTERWMQWGDATDLPVPADYDGDQEDDIAIFRPSSGEWWISRSSAGQWVVPFGQAGDLPIPDDYDRDGKDQPAVYRPGSGRWILRSMDGQGLTLPWGVATDQPAPGHYDDDDHIDYAVVRDGVWWILYARENYTQYDQLSFGEAGDQPIPRLTLAPIP